MVETAIIPVTPPAGGKNTFCDKVRPSESGIRYAKERGETLVQHPAFVGKEVLVIEMGQHFREMKQSGHKDADTVRRYEERGLYVPDQIVLEAFDNVWKQNLSRIKKTKVLVLNGIPRTKIQARVVVFDYLRGELGVQNILLLVARVEDDILRQRIAERRKLGGRIDDHDHLFETRLSEYRKREKKLVKTIRNPQYCDRVVIEDVREMRRQADDLIEKLGFSIPSIHVAREAEMKRDHSPAPATGFEFGNALPA